jgi:hypothetical protein
MAGGYKYGHTDRWERFRKYTAEIGSRAMIYIARFVSTGLCVQHFMGSGYKDTHRQQRNLISLILHFFFPKYESRLKIVTIFKFLEDYKNYYYNTRIYEIVHFNFRKEIILLGRDIRRTHDTIG